MMAEFEDAAGVMCQKGSFEYQSDFDKNGVLYWLGTKGGARPWQNPADAGAVKVTASQWNTGRVQNVVNYSAIQAKNYSQNTANSWVMVELPVHITPNKYTILHGYQTVRNQLRNWDLEGSADGVNFTVIRSHRNDSGLSGNGYCTNTWDLDTDQPFSHFRLSMKGTDSNGLNHLMCAGLEFYGLCTPPEVLAEWGRIRTSVSTAIASRDRATLVREVLAASSTKPPMQDPLLKDAIAMIENITEAVTAYITHELSEQNSDDVIMLVDGADNQGELRKKIITALDSSPMIQSSKYSEVPPPERVRVLRIIEAILLAVKGCPSSSFKTTWTK